MDIIFQDFTNWINSKKELWGKNGVSIDEIV